MWQTVWMNLPADLIGGWSAVYSCVQYKCNTFQSGNFLPAWCSYCHFLLEVSQCGCSLYLNSVQRTELYFYVSGLCFTTSSLLLLLTLETAKWQVSEGKDCYGSRQTETDCCLYLWTFKKSILLLVFALCQLSSSLKRWDKGGGGGGAWAWAFSMCV